LTTADNSGHTVTLCFAQISDSPNFVCPQTVSRNSALRLKNATKVENEEVIVIKQKLGKKLNKLIQKTRLRKRMRTLPLG